MAKKNRMTKNTNAEKWIKSLTQLQGLLSDNEKADIILDWFGLKPAAMIEVSCYKRMSKKDFLKKVATLKNILTGLGLRYKLHLNYPKRSNEVTRYSFVAKNEKIFKRIIVANAEKDIIVRRQRVGKLLGYPSTAIKAFSETNHLHPQDLPIPIKDLEILKFLNFRLSKNWRTELSYVKRRMRIIKRVAPDLYKKIINKKRAV